VESSFQDKFGRTIYFLQSDDTKCYRDEVCCKEGSIECAFDISAAKGKGLDDGEDKQGRTEELNGTKDGGGNVVENTAIRRLSDHERIMWLNFNVQL